MKILKVILNLPWTLIGLFTAVLSFPTKIILSRNPGAIVFYYGNFWWYQWLPGKRQVRALTNGNIIQMSRYADERDLTHELIHVEQHFRWPFIFPALYFVEMLRHGYRIENKYEKEAYERSNSRYGNFVP